MSEGSEGQRPGRQLFPAINSWVSFLPHFLPLVIIAHLHGVSMVKKKRLKSFYIVVWVFSQLGNFIGALQHSQ